MSEQPHPVSPSTRSATPPTTSSAPSTPLYAERLWVPLWWWPIGFGIAGVLAYEVTMGIPALPQWLPYLLLLPVPAWALYWLSRHRLEVAPDAAGITELRVDLAHLPVTYVARAAAVPASAKSAALGRQLDPAAFVQHRPWVGPMVALVLNDPDDPAPYWLISTRHPDRVLAALNVPAEH